MKIKAAVKSLNIHKEYCQGYARLVKATTDQQWEEVGEGLLLYAKTKNNEYLLILAYFNYSLTPWQMIVLVLFLSLFRLNFCYVRTYPN